MSRPEDGQRHFFPSGNPFRHIFSKGSYLSPKLEASLNSFEQSLTARLKQLKPRDTTDILSLSWMRMAMEYLCETHVDIKALITDLQFPVSDWDEKWVDIYLNSSIKLLDICIAFSSELSRLNQGHLLLQYAVHILEPVKDSASLEEQLTRAHSSLHDWKQQICSKNPKLDNCMEILQELTRSLHLAKIKSSAKGIVLMRAMFGVKIMTVFVCSVFVAALSDQANVLIDLHVSEKFSWSEPFNDLQACVSGEVKSLLNGKVTVLKELKAVKGDVEKVSIATGGGHLTDTGSLQNPVLALAEHVEKFAEGVDILSKQVDCFFHIVLSGRDALLCNLRVSDLEEGNNADS